MSPWSPAESRYFRFFPYHPAIPGFCLSIPPKCPPATVDGCARRRQDKRHIATLQKSGLNGHFHGSAAVSAPDTMKHTAQTVLGAVLDLPPEQSTLLLQTLAAWRDNGGSATATARQMFCHPNTIRQRLRKLESWTGRSLSDPRATAELFLALEATLLLPSSSAQQVPGLSSSRGIFAYSSATDRQLQAGA
jgi:hypothetical protein